MDSVKKDIVLACKRMAEKGFVANHDGNISFVLDDGNLLATPTSFAKGDVTEEDLLILDPGGKVISGKHKVFSEISWHRAIYKVRHDVRCIVHAHPPVAGGFGLARREIGVPAIPEAIVSLGKHILTTGFISPLDSNAFEIEFGRALAESDACLVPGNGVWAVGETILQAYLRLELVEHIAHQHFVAEQLGTVHRLPEVLVAELLRKRPNRARVKQPMDDLRQIVRSELQSMLERAE